MICICNVDFSDIEDKGKLYDIKPIFSSDIGR
jgi:hypothetical protein